MVNHIALLNVARDDGVSADGDFNGSHIPFSQVRNDQVEMNNINIMTADQIPAG